MWIRNFLEYIYFFVIKPIKEKPTWENISMYVHRVHLCVCMFVCVCKDMYAILYFSLMFMNHRKPILDFLWNLLSYILNPDAEKKAKIKVKCPDC